MKNFFSNLGAKTQQWMAGRYGFDELSRALSVFTLIGLIISCIPGLEFMYIPSIVLLLWSMFRCYSRNLEKRRSERSAWLGFTGNIKGWFAMKKKAWAERGTHRYFRCSKCKTVLRVPKGKGRIRIVCSKCRNEMVKKT